MANTQRIPYETIAQIVRARHEGATYGGLHRRFPEVGRSTIIKFCQGRARLADVNRARDAIGLPALVCP